jgi:hypothetical protein
MTASVEPSITPAGASASIEINVDKFMRSDCIPVEYAPH